MTQASTVAVDDLAVTDLPADIHAAIVAAADGILNGRWESPWPSPASEEAC